MRPVAGASPCEVVTPGVQSALSILWPALADETGRNIHMKLWKACSALAFCASLGLGFAAQGCSDSATSTTTSSSGTGAPPAKPSAPATTSTTKRTFALNQIHLGDATREGAGSQTAWKGFGYNLDGKTSDSKSTDVCKRVAGAGSSNQVDGDKGIDNAFGLTIMAIISGVQPEASKTVATAIADGTFTVLVEVSGLDGTPKQTNTGLSGQIFAGGDFGSIDANKGKKPTFTSSDNWPVIKDSTASGTVESGGLVKLNDAYVVDGLFVARADNIKINVVVAGQPISLNIRKAIVSFQVDGTNAKNGTIAGIITNEELVTELKKVINNFTSNFCDPKALEDVLNLIRQAADITSDGTNAAGTTCDAISVGIGFNGAEIGPVKDIAVPTASTSTDQCKPAAPDAGTTDSGNQSQDAGPK
jgi:hypothetical protein